MAKAVKKYILPLALIALAVIIILAVLSLAGLASLRGEADFDRAQYRQQLTSIYQQYDSVEKYENYENGSEFAFARLLVNDYNGKKYGAVAAAVDEKNGFAVLQYASPSEAEKAYYKFQADGLLVDADGTAELNAEQGSLYPEGSNAVGTPQYINKFAMASDEVTVALIDTGVMCDHEALTGRFVSRGYDYSEDGMEDAYFDTEMKGENFGHATFIAGIIADNTPDTVKIIPYKVVPFGALSATASSIISAINDAVDSGATVLNISITSASSGNSFRRAIKNAKESGVCVCAAAGNQASEINGIYPAGVDETITVSALENDFSTFASFSNYGSYVDFCATGRKVYSLAPYVKSSDSRYRRNSGTSFSSPYIAALCADIKTIDNEMSVDDVCSVLRDFSVDLGDEGRDDCFGWGMPVISDIRYTDGENYDLKIPEGTLDITGDKDYTTDTLPWRIFASKLMSVTVDSSVDRIGDYTFYNVKANNFTMRETYDKIGDYAFYGCKNVKEYNFTIDCEEVGVGAFGGIENIELNGYRNTPAEMYALSENIKFNVLGCKHNYITEVIDPTETDEGYTIYTCSVCGDTYNGAYITPELVTDGVCGESLTYSYYDTGKLVIDGTGDMYDYINDSAPWSEYASDIRVLEIGRDVGKISQLAFYGTHIVRMRCSGNECYTVENNALYSKDMSALVLIPEGDYTMPATVTSFEPQSLILLGRHTVTFNDNFTVENSLVFDEGGKLICALPSYNDASLVIDENIIVGDFAFILTPYPESVYVNVYDAEFGEYSLGYYFNGSMTKRDVTFFTYDSGSGVEYAQSNGFDIDMYNRGSCGERIEWSYDINNAVLTLSGTGDMYSYSSQQEIPWSEYLGNVAEIIISDDITSVSDYAFYNAAKLRRLTLPLSLSAPENATSWKGCTSIKTITFTFGSGYMDDYATDEVTYYQNTPWYLSRKSLEDFSVPSDVKYVGRHAFRGCSALASVTLDSCEEIAEDAFLACANLRSVTILSKSCKIADYALLSYKVSSYGIYSSHVLYGYIDSTAKDYCDKFGAQFSSLGCGHSRGNILISSDEHECCAPSVYNYVCSDCGEEFTEYVKNPIGHYVKAALTNGNGKGISDADVYIDGRLTARTNSDGKFIADGIPCGEHSVSFNKNDIELLATTVTVDKSNTSGELCINYGDLNGDGFINGRDLATAKTNHISDYKLFDYGSAAGENSVITSQYAEQALPIAAHYRFEPDSDSDYRMKFYATIENDSEFTLTSCGFLYGVRMDEDDLVLEKANTEAENGYTVKCAESVNFSNRTKALLYGIKSRESWFGVRFYITYTNGVKNYTYYSNVYKYVY